MSSSQTIKHYLGISLLFLWGGVLLYFYATGRIVNYLPPDEGFHFFRTQCLIGGIVLCVIGAFNLLMSRREESCSHEHEHAHNHEHEHHDDAPDQARPHVPEPDRPDPHEPDPDRVKPHQPGPDHSPPPTPELVLPHAHSQDHGHQHAHGGCCGHDHGHQPHDEAHGSTNPRAVAHIHGDQSLPQFMISVILLAAPLAYSALTTPDAFSINALENKGLYNNSAAVNPAAAAKYDLNKDSAKGSVADLMAASKASGTPDSPAPRPAVEKFSIKDLDAQVKKTPAGAYILEVPELFLSTADREVREVLEGLSVETTGQILPEKVNNPRGTRLRIMRLYVQCCAADASPMAFAVEFGKTPPEVKERSWVKVTGKMSYVFEGGVTVPVLKAEKFEETEPLEEGMAY